MLSLRQNLRLSLRGSSAAVLSLDFLSATSLDARITFTRGSSATRVNSSGLIESVSSNVARFDYDPVTLAAKGLLIEEARTNLLLQSQTLDNASWGKGSSTVSANTATAPDGTVSADTLIPNNGTALASATVQQDISKAASATTYTVTVYAKEAGYNRILIRCQDSAGVTNRADVTVSLVNGSITSAAAVAGTFTSASAVVAAAANGFYRVALTFTSSADTFLRTLVFAQDSTATTGNGTSGIYLWGAQNEAGAFATSYIPTVASTVTRSADVATMTGTNFSSWYNQSAGTFVAEYDSVAATIGPSTKAIASANDNTGNNRVYGYLANTGAPALLVTNGGATEANPLNSVIANATVAKSAWGYALNDFAIVTNGGTAATDATGMPPTAPNKLEIGNHLAGAPINGHIRSIAYYNTRLPNAQLQSLTA